MNILYELLYKVIKIMLTTSILSKFSNHWGKFMEKSYSIYIMLCCVLAQAEQHESKLNQMPRLWLETIGLGSYSLSDDLISLSKFEILFKFDSQFAPHSNGLEIKTWCVLTCHAILYQLCILT